MIDYAVNLFALIVYLFCAHKRQLYDIFCLVCTRNIYRPITV